VVSRVLADPVDLAEAFGYERANFREHRFGRTAPVFAAHLRDHAKTAGMIAALGNLHISRMGRRQPKARRVVIRNVTRSRVGEGKACRERSRRIDIFVVWIWR